MPLSHHIVHIVNSRNKCFDQLLLTAKFRASIHRFLDGNKNLFVLTVRIVVLFHKHQDVIDVNLNLANKLHLKDNIVRDVLFFSFVAIHPFVPQILIPAQVIL